MLLMNKKNVKSVKKKATKAPTKKNAKTKSTKKSTTLKSQPIAKKKTVTKKKGFTLIELILVIVIVGVLGLLVVPRISSLISSGKNTYYTTIEKEMTLLAKDYYADQMKELPLSGSSVELTMSKLLYNNYITEMIKDATQMPCNNSFIIVTSKGNKKYEYVACLFCDDYNSQPKICKEHASAAVMSMETLVKNHQVLEPITNEEKNEIKRDLIAKYSYINNTIGLNDIVLDLNGVNTNKLGNYTFTYVIPKAGIYKYAGVIKVKDLVAPTITGDTVYTTKGQPADIWKYITVSDNYYDTSDITKRYEEIDTVDINTPGNYRIKITAIDKDNNVREKEIILKVIEKIATFTPEEKDWSKNDATARVDILNLGGLEVSSWTYRTGVLGTTTTWGNKVTGSGSTQNVTLSSNGINIIEVEITYRDGTKFVQQSGQYKIDKEEPTCGGVSGSDTTWTNETRTVSVGCTDDLSGCEHTSYSKVYSSTKKTDTITIKDAVGNEKVCPVDVYVDKTKPTCGTISTVPSGASNTSWVSGQRQVNVTCNDSDSLCVTTTYTRTYTASQTTGEITIKDNANNEQTCTVGIYLDTDTPTKPTVTGTVATNTNGFRNTLTVTGGTSTSGIKGYEYCEMTSNTTSGCTWKSYSNGVTYSTKGTTYFFARAVNNANTKGTASNAYIVKIVNPVLTYDNNNGSGCTSKEGIYQSAWGELCTPTRQGYTFSGWYNGSTQVTSSTTATGNITVTAKWTANTYVVEYYQGSTKLTSSTHTYDTAQNLTTYSGTVPTNWTSFYGWGTGTSSTSRTYTNEQNVTNLSSTNNGTIKLYAIFSRTVNVYSGLNKATNNSKTQYYNPYNTSYVTSISLTNPTAITNWEVLGYRDDQTADVKEYDSTASVKPTYNASANYYAVYSRSYTATFYSGVSKATTKTKASDKAYYNTNTSSLPTKVSITLDTAANSTDISNWTELGWRDDTTAETKKYGYGASATVAFGTNFYSTYSRTLTINYSANGGSGSVSNTTKTIYLNSNATSTSSQQVTLAANTFTAPTGYKSAEKWTIDGVDYNANGSGNYTPSLAYNESSFAKTAKAKWAADTYTIAYYQGNGTSTAGSTQLGTSTCNYGVACSLTKYANLGSTFPDSAHGWTFAGWSTSQTGTSVDYTDGKSVTSIGNPGTTVKLYAVGKRDVTFASGQAPTSLLATKTQYWNPYQSGTSYVTGVDIPNATSISGWTFVGYRATNDASSTVTIAAANAGTSYKLNSGYVSSVFRSIYSREATLAYGANGGSGTTPTSQKLTQYYNSGYPSNGSNSGANTVGGSITLASNVFAKSGYEQKGWNTKVDGAGTSYTAGSSYTLNPGVTSNATVTLYAKWIPNTIKLTLNKNGGTGGTSEVWYKYGTSKFYSNSGCTTEITSVTLPTKSGYTLDRYNGDGSSGGNNPERYIYSDGTFANDLATDIYKDATLYAVWTGKTYTVTHYQGNGTSTAGNKSLGTTSCTFGTACTLKTYATLGGTFPDSSHGWAFAGWSTSQTGTDRTYSNGGSINPSTYAETVNIYAVGSRSVTFASGKAPTSLLATKTQYWNPYQSGTSYVTGVDVPSATAISGWTFIGYRATNDASSTVTIAAANAGTSYKLNSGYVSSVFRSIYSRTLTMAYNANGGSGTTASHTGTQYYNSGYPSSGSNSGANVTSVSFTLKTNGFTKAGYNFTKWADGSASGTQYAAGASYSFGPAVGATTLTKTMYAIWNFTGTGLFTYTGTYELINEGSGNWRAELKTGGTFTPGGSMNVDISVTGGGGAGASPSSWETSKGTGAGGCGGASAYVKNKTLSATGYTVTIGAGGAPTYGTKGGDGKETSFKNGSTTIVSAAGGGGGGASTSNWYKQCTQATTGTGDKVLKGGLGAAGSTDAQATYNGVKGSVGNYAFESSSYLQYGAGGASGSARNVSAKADSNGVKCNQNTGVAYGGGGGGSSKGYGSDSSCQWVKPTSASANSGSGGGGGCTGYYGPANGGQEKPYRTGGNGGSGIVIIRNAR